MPGSVDSLQKDWSDKDGHPPLFFHETSVEALDMHLFSRGVDNDECELGADQVILVRDMETKRAVGRRVPLTPACRVLLSISFATLATAPGHGSSACCSGRCAGLIACT